MSIEFHLLKKNDLPGEIEIHTDLLSIMPSALSRKRALKVGAVPQEEMQDRNNMNREEHTKAQLKCVLCHPNQKGIGASDEKVLFKDRVAYFANDYPYLPGDQKVLYLYHSNPDIREKYLHRFKLSDFSRIELYWLLKGVIKLGNDYSHPQKKSYDLMRMIAGFNLGSLAGQSLPHFHMQYGWEVALDRKQISEKELELYFEELEQADIVLYQNDRIKVVVPWTPKGQFAVDIYFKNKFEIVKMDEDDIKIYAIFGERIIKKYLELGIQNLNIVFSNSPKDREIEPLVVHFVPRVNMTALYEIGGVNVVDTPPQMIVEEFRRLKARGGENISINWSSLADETQHFEPDQEFLHKINANNSPGPVHAIKDQEKAAKN